MAAAQPAISSVVSALALFVESAERNAAFCVALVLLIIYIGIRFEFKMGFTAVVVLLHDLIIVIGIYALFGREFTPNAVAALLSLIGYSLYDTVVVFHRIADNMENSDIKCTFMTMANHSMNQVFMRSINTSLTSLFPVVFMLLFGSETLQDFAFAMVIGLIAGCYSSIAIACPLFSMWKTREPEYAKLEKKYGNEVGRFEFARGALTATKLAPSAAAATAGAGASDADVQVPVTDISQPKADQAPKTGAQAAKSARKGVKSGQSSKGNYHYSGKGKKK